MNRTIFHGIAVLLFGLLLGLASVECRAAEATIQADSSDTGWEMIDLPVSELPLRMETESKVQTSPLSGHSKVSSRWNVGGSPNGRCRERNPFACKRSGLPEMSRNDWTFFLQSISLRI